MKIYDFFLAQDKCQYQKFLIIQGLSAASQYNQSENIFQTQKDIEQDYRGRERKGILMKSYRAI
jgi:hypothetical protein